MIFDSLRKDNVTVMESITQKQEVLLQIKAAKDKLKEKRRELIDASDKYAQEEIHQVKLQEQLGALRQRVNIEKPVDDAKELAQKLEKELADKENEVADVYASMTRLQNQRAMDHTSPNPAQLFKEVAEIKDMLISSAH